MTQFDSIEYEYAISIGWAIHGNWYSWMRASIKQVYNILWYITRLQWHCTVQLIRLEFDCNSCVSQYCRTHWKFILNNSHRSGFILLDFCIRIFTYFSSKLWGTSTHMLSEWNILILIFNHFNQVLIWLYLYWRHLADKKLY